VAGVLIVLVLSQFRRYTLATRTLLAFLFLALTPLAIVSWVNDQQARADLRASAQQALYATASQTAGQLDAFLNTTRSAVGIASRSALLRDFLSLPSEQRDGSPLKERVHTWLSSLTVLALPGTQAADTQVVQSFFLLDTQGNLAATTAPLTGPQYEFSRTDIFILPLTSRRDYISPVKFSTTGTSHIYFASPVPGQRNAPAGILIAQVNAAWLQRIVSEASTTPGAGSRIFAALFDENTLRLTDAAAERTNANRFAQLPETNTLTALEAGSRLPRLEIADLNGNLPDLAGAVRQAQSGSMRQPVYFTGIVHQAPEPEPQHLTAMVPVRSLPWVVMAAQPESVALAPASVQTRNIVLAGLLIALAVAGLAALATRTLTGPLSALTQAAERVAAGDLSARAETTATDEIGTLTRTFNTMTGQLQETLTTLEERVAERTAQLQATADISRATAGVRNLPELLDLAVEMIRARFGFYHASVFLIDEAQEYAVLHESTGEIGAQLKAAGHRLAIGSRSLVGWVTQNRKLRVARDVADDPFHFKNPLLPETRSELCMPLMVGDRLLGVLDVQSRAVDAFGEEALRALQVLADQLSIAIENAESFERTQAALAEARTRYEQAITTEWRDVVGAKERELVYDLEPGGAVSAAPIKIPLRLRDRTIGVIELHGRPGGDRLAEEEQSMITALAAQLSTALESSVLVQESQQRGRRERLITEITDELRSTLNPAFILQSGIRQLGRALGATEVVVKLQPGQPQPVEQPRGSRPPAGGAG
jgi:GAF domain-containing protein/HAMP domain-containing protein